MNISAIISGKFYAYLRYILYLIKDKSGIFDKDYTQDVPGHI